MRIGLPPKLQSRFELRDTGYDTPCWIWTGGTGEGGYGRVRQGKKIKQAHRVAYEAGRGPIPTGLIIDHLCRTPACINPDHLEPVTSAQNTQRGNNARLTAADARAIRSSSKSQRELAAEYGVTQQCIQLIRKNKRWRSLPSGGKQS